MTEQEIQLNYYPITIEFDTGTPSTENPQANTPAVVPENSNILNSANGSVVGTGTVQSPNFAPGAAGWRLDSNGNIEANDGNFRGDITGASGTFSGTVSVGQINIGGDDATSAHIDTDGNFWSGASIANKATAPLRISNVGALDIGGDDASSAHIDETGNLWLGASVANKTTAPFKVSNAGTVVAGDITATGTINANAGYLGNGVYIDTVNGLLVESEGFNVGTAGHIRGGQTAYDTGTGFYLGYSGGAYKFSIGNSTDTSKLLTWDGTDLRVNDSLLSSQDIFGNGADGDVTISADTTLAADMYYNNLTVNSTYTLKTGGYRIFVKGILTNNGTISRDGLSDGTVGGTGGTGGSGGSGGTAGTGATALADGSIAGGENGRNGGIGATGMLSDNGSVGGASSGSNTAKSLGASGKSGGNGGSSGNAGTNTGTTGGAGTGGSKSGTIYNYPKNLMAAYWLYDIFPTPDYLKSSCESGGGGGGASGAEQHITGTGRSGGGGGGGGAGGAGGIVFISARKVVNNASCYIQANGGNGKNGGDAGAGYTSADGVAGGSGGGGGGNGGSGGVIIMIYSLLTNSGTIQVVGGSGGTGGNKSVVVDTSGTLSGTDGVNGDNGTTGNSGTIIYITV